MALATTHKHFDLSAIGAAFARPFKAVFRGLIVLAEADSRMVQVRKLNALTISQMHQDVHGRAVHT